MVNIVYINTLQDTHANAETINYPKSTLTGPVSLVYRASLNDPLAGTTRTMNIGPGKLVKGEPDISGLLVTNNFGDPTSNAQLYGRGIAHEISHVLGLEHRGDPDGPSGRRRRNEKRGQEADVSPSGK